MNERPNHQEENPEKDSVTEESRKRREIVERIKQRLNENSDKLKELFFFRIYVFGSTIRGNARAESDIDVCIITEPEYHGGSARQLPREKLIRELFAVSDEFEVVTFFRRETEREKKITVNWDHQKQDNIQLPEYLTDPKELLWSSEE